MPVFHALILGAIQGLSEFIPISSSAHLIIVPWLLGWNDGVLTSLSFDVALHLGTLLALLIYFAGDWLRLIKAWFASIWERCIADNVERRLAWYLVIGSIPGGLVGLLAESGIERLFHEPQAPPAFTALIAMALIVAAVAVAMFMAERLATHARPLQNLSMKDALWIGLAQALAVFPGVSRSGSTITAGLALGLERAAAARFSFLLSAPIIAGAGIKTMWDLFWELQGGAGWAAMEWPLFGIGILSAAISGYFCIKYLLKYLQKNSTDLFIYYRWGLAVVIVVVALLRN